MMTLEECDKVLIGKGCHAIEWVKTGGHPIPAVNLKVPGCEKPWHFSAPRYEEIIRQVSNVIVNTAMSNHFDREKNMKTKSSAEMLKMNEQSQPTTTIKDLDRMRLVLQQRKSSLEQDRANAEYRRFKLEAEMSLLEAESHVIDRKEAEMRLAAMSPSPEATRAIPVAEKVEKAGMFISAEQLSLLHEVVNDMTRYLQGRNNQRGMGKWLNDLCEIIAWPKREITQDDGERYAQAMNHLVNAINMVEKSLEDELNLGKIYTLIAAAKAVAVPQYVEKKENNPSVSAAVKDWIIVPPEKVKGFREEVEKIRNWAIAELSTPTEIRLCAFLDLCLETFRNTETVQGQFVVQREGEITLTKEQWERLKGIEKNMTHLDLMDFNKETESKMLSIRRRFVSLIDDIMGA